MKKTLFPILILIVLILASGCTGKAPGKKDLKSEIDSTTVPDTGYTGIRNYMSGQYKVMEVTFKNGVRDGLLKSYYLTGELRHTFWYKNGLREDSSQYFYLEGQVFRTTPYVHDTIDGIQKQYYRTGKIKAKIGYRKGLRTDLFEEYTPDGRLLKEYPEIVVNINDEYKAKGAFRIGLELTDKSSKVKFYRGDFIEGRFDSTMCKTIKVTNGRGMLELRKTGSTKPEYVGVVASVLTPFGNRKLVWKKIKLPYNDLN